jgi:hypothetical protein
VGINMPVIYNSNAIIPGPMLDIRRELVRSESGKNLRQFYSIQAKGKISAYKGSPNSSGKFWTGSYYPGPVDENIPSDSRLASLRSKMGALNDLFCTQGQWFEIQPFDGTQSIKFQPVVKNIAFAPTRDNWTETADYTIDMEAATIYFGNAETCGFNNVVPEETWSIEAADQIGRTYRLTHTVSSTQKLIYAADGGLPAGSHGWERARAIVLQHLGLQDPTKMYAPGVLNLNTWQVYNYFRSQNIDEGAGRFSVTETWLVYDAAQGGVQPLPPALDDYTINSRVGDDGITHVTIEGTVTGLEVRDIINGTLLQTRWNSAVLYFNSILFNNNNIFNRAVNYSGIVLNPVQLVSTIGRNPIQGTITYNAEFNNRRLPLIPGALRENISVQAGGGTDVFASIPVPGRPWGPVLQAIDTITERSTSITIDAQMHASTMLFPIQYMPNTDGLVLSFAPIAVQIFRSKDDVNWSQETGKYNRSASYVYQ